MLRSLRYRTLHTSLRALAKNDKSTIDSYRLPSQTSINEWEFKYDFIPKVAEPKIPPVSPEAIKQDVAHQKKQEVETELRQMEHNSSVKVEANDASVVHGGEAVSTEPELLHDKGSDPVDASHNVPNDTKPKKTANTEKYVQSSVNPGINEAEVVNLGHENEVDHKTGNIEHGRVVDDVEHDQKKEQAESKLSPAVLFGVLGLGAGTGYYLFHTEKDEKKAAK